jgi:hypothetical protein
MSGVEGAEREDYDDGEAGVRKVGRNQARTGCNLSPISVNTTNHA